MAARSRLVDLSIWVGDEFLTRVREAAFCLIYALRPGSRDAVLRELGSPAPNPGNG